MRIVFHLRFRVGELRPRVEGISGVVRFVHSFRYLRHVTAAVEMVYTGRLFDRTVAHTHHQLYKVVERKSNNCTANFRYKVKSQKIWTWLFICKFHVAYRTRCASLAS